MAGEQELYLRPSGMVDAANEAIQETAKRVTLGCTCDEERTTRLFYFVRDTIRYSVYMISHPPRRLQGQHDAGKRAWLDKEDSPSHFESDGL